MLRRVRAATAFVFLHLFIIYVGLSIEDLPLKHLVHRGNQVKRTQHSDDRAVLIDDGQVIRVKLAHGSGRVG